MLYQIHSLASAKWYLLNASYTLELTWSVWWNKRQAIKRGKQTVESRLCPFSQKLSLVRQVHGLKYEDANVQVMLIQQTDGRTNMLHNYIKALSAMRQSGLRIQNTSPSHNRDVFLLHASIRECFVSDGGCFEYPSTSDIILSAWSIAKFHYSRFIST
jgi:hypothetical protein